jgi:hypothetical protein
MKLTEPDPHFARLVQITPEGMAFWASTGPPGATCGECTHYGYEYTTLTGRDLVEQTHKKNGCALYYQQMHRHAERMLPEDTPACKYFEPLWQLGE